MKKKRINRKGVWMGITSIMSFLTIIAVLATTVLQDYSGILNQYLGIATTQIIEKEGENEDTIYYKSEFGEFTSENLKKVDEAAFEQTRNEAREGSTLLKNSNDALPLGDDETRVTLFGHASWNPLYRTYAAGSSLTTDPEWTTDLKEALEAEGFKINETLWNAYADDPAIRPADERGKGGSATNTENPGSFYEKYSDSWANDYNDVAIVVIARQGGESTDMAVSEQNDSKDEMISSLALHDNERQMMDIVSKGSFGKVIVLINSPYAMELGWLDEYDVDACLWISTVGSSGFTGVAEILSGEVNPSGLLTDTWAADSLSSPAVANGNGNTPMWENMDEIHDSGIVTDGTDQHPLDSEVVIGYVNVQQENIYVGYKYYETRYADVIMGEGDAASSVGAFVSTGDIWNYSEEVCYPFGFGLSYTTFSQEITSVRYNSDSDTYDVTVNVTNTGDVAGKKAVVLYAQTPYGEYERTNYVEKAAVQLVGYDKTDMLEPGDSEEIIITVDRYLLASYDDNYAKGYILSGGDYYFAVGDSSHDALNNILSVQGYDELVDYDGNAVEGNANAVTKIETGVPSDNSNPDAQVYSHSQATGYTVTNLFDYADYNYWEEDTGVTVDYLTRQDWSGTFPTEAAKVVIKGEGMENLLQGNVYETAEDAPSVDSFTFGANNGLTFAMMKDVAWEEDIMWNKFLDQFTLEELASMVKDMPGNYAIESIALPEIQHSDGCDSSVGRGYLEEIGWGDQKETNTYNAGRGSVVYTSLLAATYNPDLQVRRGELMAEEMMYAGINVSCTGGSDIRRTPFSGRNAEYFSEDANLTSLVGAYEMGTMQGKGVIGGPKHFAGNDQEYMRLGVTVFTTEQAFREGSLRGFEYVLRKDKADLHYTMTTNVRIGMKWTPLNSELLTDVLRDEWGFAGTTNTDSSFKWPNGFTSNIVPALMAGTDTNYGNTTDDPSNVYLTYLKENDDGNVVLRLREVAKNCIYAWSRSCGINGLSSSSEIVTITPTWEIAVRYIDIALVVLTVASYVMLAFSWKRRK